jgi:hypothetical protein
MKTTTIDRTIRYVTFGFFDGLMDLLGAAIVGALMAFALWSFLGGTPAYPDELTPTQPATVGASGESTPPGAPPSIECMNCGGTIARFDAGVTCEFVAGDWKCGPRAWLYYEAGAAFGDQDGVTLGRLFAEGAMGLRNSDLLGAPDTGETVTPTSIRIAAGYKFYFSRRSYAAPEPKPGTNPADVDSRPRTVLMGVYARIGGEFSPTSDQVYPNFARQVDAGINVEVLRGEENTFSLKAGVGEDETLNPPGSVPARPDGSIMRTLVGIVEGSVPIVRKDKLSGKIVGRISQQLMNQASLERGARVELAIAAGWN